MYQTINFKIITPEKIFFEHLVEIITFPNIDGEFSVMKGHMYMISTIIPGIISSKSENNIDNFVISGGLLNIDSECCLFTEQVIRLTDMTDGEIISTINTLKEEMLHFTSIQKTFSSKKSQMIAILEKFIKKNNV